jgi:hypothetical protein
MSKHCLKLRTRWEDVIQMEALQILGTQEWRRQAGDREAWRCLFREAKDQKSL